MAEPSLLPCPFCGAPAEMDTRRHYRNITTGVLGQAIAVYCTGCSADVSVCKADVPDIEPEQVVEMWNRRAGVVVDDLAHTVRKLVHALRQAAPEHDLPAKALDYLKRHGLQGSPLRDVAAPSPTEARRIVDLVAAERTSARNQALEEAAVAITQHDRKGREWIRDSLWDTLSTEAAARIRALAIPSPASEGPL